MNEPEPVEEGKLTNAWIAILPLVVVGVLNKLLTYAVPTFYGPTHTTTLAGLNHPLETNVTSLAAIWALELALVAGILTVIGFGYKGVVSRFAEGTKGGRGRIAAGRDEYCFGIRLRRGDRRASGISCGQERAGCDPQSARQ